MSSIEPPKETLQKHLDRQGRISQWITVEAFNWLRDAQKRQAANEEAENRWFRKTVSGDDGAVESESDMGTTILGDITPQPPVIIQQPPQQSNNLGTIAAIVAAMATGGILGSQYLGNQAVELVQPQQPQQQQPMTFEDSTVSVGLGKLEDYESLKP